MNNSEIKKALQNWGEKVKKYQRPSTKKSKKRGQEKWDFAKLVLNIDS